MDTAIITGTTRGLGKALEAAFIASGWIVVALNRPTFDLGQIDVQVAENAMRQITPNGRIVFVNNAATHHIAPASEMTHDVIGKETNINIVGPITLISTFLRVFPSGEVANITSAAATTAFAHWSLYSAAKAALNSFIEVLKVEGVKCFNLNPGAVATDMQVAIASSSSPLPSGVQLRSAEAVAKNLVWQISRG